jgi:hypothetical protein
MKHDTAEYQDILDRCKDKKRLTVLTKGNRKVCLNIIILIDCLNKKIVQKVAEITGLPVDQIQDPGNLHMLRKRFQDVTRGECQKQVYYYYDDKVVDKEGNVVKDHIVDKDSNIVDKDGNVVGFQHV